MKRYILVCLGLAIALQACKKEKIERSVVIPPDAVETAPVIGDTQPSKDNIVYRKLNMRLGYNKPIFLDANADQTSDISFSSVLIMQNGKQYLYLSAYGKSGTGNKLFVKKGEELANGSLYAYPFAKDETVEPTDANQVKVTAAQQKATVIRVITTGSQTSVDGLWANKTDKYMGFALKMNGEPHFGWIKLSHDAATNEIIVSEYAYNKIPGEDIIAGEK